MRLISPSRSPRSCCTWAALAVVALAPLIVAACGGADDTSATTTGKRITLATRIVVDERARAPFVTRLGWKVTLDKAALSVGALYYFDGEPAFVRLSPRPSRFPQQLIEWLGPRTAWAHPGHYQTGNALGEMRTPSSVDLLSGPAALADADGVTGAFNSARFVFGDGLVGPAAPELAGNAAVASGVAMKSDSPDSEEKHFVFVASLAEIATHVAHGAVDGCAFESANVETDGTVTVRVDPTTWFGLVDFSNVAPGTPDSPTMVSAGEVARIAFTLGLAQLSAYHFSFAK